MSGAMCTKVGSLPPPATGGFKNLFLGGGPSLPPSLSPPPLATRPPPRGGG